MADKSKYFTRSRANAGVVLNIKTPEGEDAGDWLRVRGVDSDAFREAKVEANRRLMAAAALETPEARTAATLDNERRMTAALVLAWSFDEPCTEDNVVAFLAEAPQVMRAVDDLVFNRDRFFGVASSNLPDTQKLRSGSEKPLPVEANPSAQT
jgi:hypothetical protein